MMVEARVLSEETMEMVKEEREKGIAWAKANNHEFLVITPEEKVLWRELFAPIHEEWIADSEAEGFMQAREIYEFIWDARVRLGVMD